MSAHQRGNQRPEATAGNKDAPIPIGNGATNGAIPERRHRQPEESEDGGNRIAIDLVDDDSAASIAR